mmetsp:Transcript_48830/g.87010  ORF Transcript_48830/g.87010 Transcript_48830/m.87010 type:complete len:151 (-) Transcript_48830:634-1086(-)
MRQFFFRGIVTGSFYITKQPARIRQVLRQVYIDKTNVDDDLVNSIEYAAQDENAPEVFFRVIDRNSKANPQSSIDFLLALLSKSYRPMLLLWGEQDPWIRPQAGNNIQRVYPKAERVSLEAGHCPHDEIPGVVNRELVAWIGRQQAAGAF